jgi:hypothetical protein
MATTYKLIDKTILTGTQATITFTGLGAYSSDYTDLKMVWSVRAGADTAVDISFNGTYSNRSRKSLFGDGSGATSTSASNFYIYGGQGRTDWTADTFSNCELYIPNYSSSNYKSFSADAVNENNSSTAYMSFTAGLWSDTAAITSIKIEPVAGSFVSGSSVYLYGIKNS